MTIKEFAEIIFVGENRNVKTLEFKETE